jgi:hypothetical protein
MAEHPLKAVMIGSVSEFHLHVLRAIRTNSVSNVRQERTHISWSSWNVPFHHQHCRDDFRN